MCELTFGEVEGEGGLISSEIVNVENEFLRKVFLGSPNDPTNSSIDETIFVSTNIDALH